MSSPIQQVGARSVADANTRAGPWNTKHTVQISVSSGKKCTSPRSSKGRDATPPVRNRDREGAAATPRKSR